MWDEDVGHLKVGTRSQICSTRVSVIIHCSNEDRV